MMFGKYSVLVISALMVGSIGCAANRPVTLFQNSVSDGPVSTGEVGDQVSCDTSCDSPSGSCDACNDSRRTRRLGSRFSHRRGASCDCPACDAPVPQPEVESSVESSEDAGTEQSSAAPTDEAADGDGNAGWAAVEDQPVSLAEGVTFPENVTSAENVTSSENVMLPESALLAASETVNEVDGAFEQEHGQDLGNGASEFEIDELYQNDSDADERDPVTAEIKNETPLAVRATDDETPAAEEWTGVEALDDSEQPEVIDSDKGEGNDFVPLNSVEKPSQTPEASPTQDKGTSILSKVAQERSGLAAQSRGPEWIRNRFLDSPARPNDEGLTGSEADEAQAPALQAVPQVADVANSVEDSIQSNRLADVESSPEKPASGADQERSVDQASDNADQGDAMAADDTPRNATLDDHAGESHRVDIVDPKTDQVRAAPPADSNGSPKPISHSTTNVLVVVNVPPSDEHQRRSTSDLSSGQTALVDQHAAGQSSERSIVLRAIPADLVAGQASMIEENLAIPPARPEPLAPLRANASIWAAESVGGPPSQQTSFVRSVDQRAAPREGRSDGIDVDRVNRGIRLRELPALLRMPQTPSPVCFPRPLNAYRATSNAAARSGRWDAIEQLPVRLRAIPQDSYGAPTSTGSRARIRVIQPSFQRQVDPDRDARMENNQTRANPQSLPAIDVERFDRELRTLAERPPSDGDTRVRR